MMLRRLATVVVAVALGVAGLAVGCSDDESTNGTGTGVPAVPCNEDPWQCADNQTCWINSAGTAFSCVNAAAAQAGDECVNYQGQPTCGPDLGCYQIQGQSSGICTPFCDPADPAHACPDSAPCQTLLFDGELTVHLCQPAGGSGGSGSGGSPSGGSGGTGGAAPSGGSGGTAGAASGGGEVGGAAGQGGAAGAGG